MKRTDLEHIIRAAGGITGARQIVVIGSQAILAGDKSTFGASCIWRQLRSVSRRQQYIGLQLSIFIVRSEPEALAEQCPQHFANTLA